MNRIIPPFTLSLFLAVTLGYTPYWALHVVLMGFAMGWLWRETR